MWLIRLAGSELEQEFISGWADQWLRRRVPRICEGDDEHHYVNGMEHDARLGAFVFARETLRVHIYSLV